MIVGIVVAYKRRAEIKNWLLAHEQHPLVKPLFVIARPLYRGVLRPVSGRGARAALPLEPRHPGELGLEVDEVAVAGVGIFVFVLYVVELSGDLGPTPLDTELLDVADEIYNAALADVAKVVTAPSARP